MAPPNISTSSTVASFVKEPSERNKAFVTFLAGDGDYWKGVVGLVNGFVLMCLIQIHSPKPNMERRSEEKAENGNNNGYSMEEKKISDIFESQEVPSWKDQLTLRAFVVSFVLGVLFTFTVMKLNLTTGIIPSLNVSAGLLGFFFIKTWSKFLERKSMNFSVWLTVLVLLFINTATVLCDIGTAASYGPPYTPTTCYGNRHGQFPPGNMFVAVSVGLWDNGAACGRRYRLRCLSGSGPNRPCKDGTIDVEVVDLCSLKPCPVTMLMSKDAYAAVSTLQGRKINIEFAQ